MVHDLDVCAGNQAVDLLALLVILAWLHAPQLLRLLRINLFLHLVQVPLHFGLDSIIKYVTFPLEKCLEYGVGPFPLVDDGVANLMTRLPVKHNVEVLWRVAVSIHCFIRTILAVSQGLRQLSVLRVLQIFVAAQELTGLKKEYNSVDLSLGAVYRLLHEDQFYFRLQQDFAEDIADVALDFVLLALGEDAHDFFGGHPRLAVARALGLLRHLRFQLALYRSQHLSRRSFSLG